MNRKIIAVSHGTVAEAVVRAAGLIMGEDSRMEALCLGEDESLESFTDRIAEKIKQPCEYIVLADVLSGTPFNACVLAKRKAGRNVRILAGYNLPMVLALMNDMDADLDTAVRNAVEAGKRMILEFTEKKAGDG